MKDETKKKITSYINHYKIDFSFFSIYLSVYLLFKGGKF